MKNAKLPLIFGSALLLLLSNSAQALPFNLDGMELFIYTVTFLIATALGILPTLFVYKKYPVKAVWALSPVFGILIVAVFQLRILI